jgi:hypothetical protein
MSARAEALRLPGKGSGHRADWYALAVFVLVAALTVALVVLTTNPPATAPAVVHPATHAQVVPVSGDGVRVGGTSVYRYHPLPPTNYSAPAAADAPAKVSVGGAGTERFHPLP